MTNDIEAAARAVIEAWDSPESHDPDAAVEVLRSALAHAARGEPVRCWRDVEGTLPARRDGDKVARVDEMVPWFLAPTPPPATGEECRWYTGNGEEYEILPPEEVRRRRIEAARRLRDVGPATGEAKCGWCGGQGYVEGSVNLRPYRIECVRCHPVATGPEIPMGGPVRIIDATPRAGASEGEVIEPLRCPASRDEVDSYLREVAFHDSTLPEPTDAMIDRVWAICRETRTLGTVAVLAVRMWEAEENIRRALRPTPPPAEGVVAKRRAALDAPTAGGGEGVDDGPVVKATSLPHRGIFGPYERHDGTMSDATPPPATGEAGAREAEIRKNERERCAKAARQAALVDYGTANQFDALCQQRDKCADAIEVRALPEAREGGGKMANRIFATYGERRVELRLCHRIGPDYSGPVWAVIVDSEGGPERFVELEEAKAHAEARVGVPLTWDATSR